MTDLIRNCAHFSTHQTLLDVDAQGGTGRTIKSTFAPEGVQGLQAEYEGLKWYASRLGADIDTLVYSFRATSGYARLVVEFVSGDVVPMPTDPGKLSQKIETAISHYLETLWTGTGTPSHGDFSLSNHVFDADGQVVRIIDWEHFNNDLPALYDPLYMVIEPLLFWHVNGKALSDSVVSTTQSQMARLHQHIGLPDDARSAPASWLRRMAEDHRSVWGKQASKVPFLNAHDHQIAKTDQVLS